MEQSAPAPPLSREALERKLQDQERWIRTLDAQIRLLERERQKLSAVVHHADAGFFVLDHALRTTWASDFLAKRLSANSHAAELLGSACHEVLCREQSPCETCPASAAFRSRGVAHCELALEMGGQTRHIYATAMPIRSPKGEVDQTMVMVQDVSDLEVLRRSDGRMKLLLGQMPAILWTTDTELRVTSSVGAGLAGLGLLQDQIVGTTLYEYFGSDDPDSLPIAAHHKAMAGEPVPFEMEWQGRAFHVHVEGLLDAGRHVIGTVGAALDVTERKKAEQAVRQSEARKDAVLRMALDAVVTMDDGGRITEWNPAAEAMFGYTRAQALGASLAELIVPERLREAHVQGLRRAVAGQSRALGRRLEMSALRRDGTEFPVEIAITRIPLEGSPAFTGYVRDLTERKQAEATLREREEQLRQSQKMEAIGTLAGGVAHDFNNILTGILGYAALLKRGAEAGGRVHKASEVIEKAAERGAALTRQLLGFARRGKNQTVPVDLGESLREVMDLIGRTVDKSIRITEYRAGVPAFVAGDPAQIQQVVLNLAVNARDAMPDGGELVLGVDAVVLGETDCLRAMAIKPGEYVLLSVRDTGSGIAEEHLPRIFEPFFTTKERGKGTGMGLAMVYGIVHNHGGGVRVESRAGEGTTFEVYLPRIAAPPVASSEAAPVSSEPAARGSGRILVVDDEEVVRQATVAFLEDLGYQVTTADDGKSALEHYAVHGAEIDLVLLDLVMPRMGGRECFRALKALDPKVRAVLCSGYGFNIAAQELLDEGVLEFLPKPYALGNLSQVVARVLAVRR